MNRARFDLVIFDCDGVLVDSEAIANEVLAEILCRHGGAFTAETALAAFVGQSVQGIRETAKAAHAIELPENWYEDYYARILPALAERVRPIAGAGDVVRGLYEAGQAICVASQGPPEKMMTTLTATGLLRYFEGRIFSVKSVERPKPFPDIFLHAAAACGVDPSKCAVVEDTRTGADAAVAAGMEVFGFCVADDAERMADCGAHPFHRMNELPALLGVSG